MKLFWWAPCVPGTSSRCSYWTASTGKQGMLRSQQLQCDLVLLLEEISSLTGIRIKILIREFFMIKISIFIKKTFILLQPSGNNTHIKLSEYILQFFLIFGSTFIFLIDLRSQIRIHWPPSPLWTGIHNISVQDRHRLVQIWIWVLYP